MRYIVDVSRKDLTEINKLIEKQMYGNLNQFVSTAITNQLLIESSDIAHGNETPASAPPAFVEKNYHNLNGYPSVDISLNLKVPDEKPSYAPMPAFSQMVPFVDGLEEGQNWMWGQFNRIFPVKLALRILILKSINQEWIDFDQFKEAAGKIALDCSEMITIKEKEEKRKREDKISAGLPKKISEDQDPLDQLKSLSRYRDHFIGNTRRRDGKFFGAMFFLKFANIKRDEKGNAFIGITESGYEFGRLANDVIDNKIFSHSLRQEEIDYYLSHIRNNVPGEFNAIKWMINKINSGIVDRTNLNNALENEFGKTWSTSNKDISIKVINTQRAGLTARITELGLITKNKDGLRVTYGLSERGRLFLESY